MRVVLFFLSEKQSSIASSKEPLVLSLKVTGPRHGLQGLAAEVAGNEAAGVICPGPGAGTAGNKWGERLDSRYRKQTDNMTP